MRPPGGSRPRDIVRRPPRRPAVFRREDYIAPAGTTPGRVPVLPARPPEKPPALKKKPEETPPPTAAPQAPPQEERPKEEQERPSRRRRNGRREKEKEKGPAIKLAPMPPSSQAAGEAEVGGARPAETRHQAAQGRHPRRQGGHQAPFRASPQARAEANRRRSRQDLAAREIARWRRCRRSRRRCPAAASGRAVPPGPARRWTRRRRARPPPWAAASSGN